MFSRIPATLRHQMLRFAQHLESFGPLLASHVDDAEIRVRSAGLRIQRQHLPEVVLRFVQPILRSVRPAPPEKVLRVLRLRLQMRRLARHFEASTPLLAKKFVAASPLPHRPAAASPQLPTEYARLTLVSLSAVVSANLRIEFKREGPAVQDFAVRHSKGTVRWLRFVM